MKDKLFTRDFSLVVIGQIISLFGNSILRFAPNWAVRHRMVVLAGCVVFFILSLLCAKTIGTEFFPAQADRFSVVSIQQSLLLEKAEFTDRKSVV